MSGAEYKAALRAMQRMKDRVQAAAKDSASRQMARKFSGAVECTCTGINTDKLKQTEESLRTVMYLSCWGLN